MQYIWYIIRNISGNIYVICLVCNMTKLWYLIRNTPRSTTLIVVYARVELATTTHSIVRWLVIIATATAIVAGLYVVDDAITAHSGPRITLRSTQTLQRSTLNVGTLSLFWTGGCVRSENIK